MGRPDVSPVLCQICSVSLHNDFEVSLTEICFLKQTRLNFKTYTNLLQDKENKFQQHLKNPNPTAISNKTPQSLLLFALKWHVLGNTAIMVDSDFN